MGVAVGRGGRDDRGDVPQARDLAAEFLCLEEEVRGPGAERVARGERQAEAAGCRPLARSAHSAGDRCKKAVKPRLRRELAEWAVEVHQLSQRRAARLIPVDRATLRYEHHRDPRDALRVRLGELAGSRVRMGIVA